MERRHFVTGQDPAIWTPETAEKILNYGLWNSLTSKDNRLPADIQGVGRISLGKYKMWNITFPGIIQIHTYLRSSGWPAGGGRVPGKVNKKEIINNDKYRIH